MANVGLWMRMLSLMQNLLCLVQRDIVCAVKTREFQKITLTAFVLHPLAS